MFSSCTFPLSARMLPAASCPQPTSWSCRPAPGRTAGWSCPRWRPSATTRWDPASPPARPAARRWQRTPRACCDLAAAPTRQCTLARALACTPVCLRLEFVACSWPPTTHFYPTPPTHPPTPFPTPQSKRKFCDAAYALAQHQGAAQRGQRAKNTKAVGRALAAFTALRQSCCHPQARAGPAAGLGGCAGIAHGRQARFPDSCSLPVLSSGRPLPLGPACARPATCLRLGLLQSQPALTPALTSWLQIVRRTDELLGKDRKSMREIMFALVVKASAGGPHHLRMLRFSVSPASLPGASPHTPHSLQMHSTLIRLRRRPRCCCAAAGVWGVGPGCAAPAGCAPHPGGCAGRRGQPSRWGKGGADPGLHADVVAMSACGRFMSGLSRPVLLPSMLACTSGQANFCCRQATDCLAAVPAHPASPAPVGVLQRGACGRSSTSSRPTRRLPAVQTSGTRPPALGKCMQRSQRRLWQAGQAAAARAGAPRQRQRRHPPGLPATHSSRRSRHSRRSRCSRRRLRSSGRRSTPRRLAGAQRLRPRSKSGLLANRGAARGDGTAATPPLQAPLAGALGARPRSQLEAASSRRSRQQTP